MIINFDNAFVFHSHYNGRMEKYTNGYVFKHYDTLHTLGEQYLVEDVVEFVREKGVAL